MKFRFTLILYGVFILHTAFSQDLSNTKISGYRGIWFELNQKYEFGDKYSGALSTYTAKHIHLAVYSPQANKTFFVYGGTKGEDSRHLLCMIGEYDHNTKMLSQPTIVHDKNGVDDPHDNPSVMIDNQGYIWVFVSGRGTQRPGFKYKSKAPLEINEFVQIFEEEFTYPQIANTKFGLFHFFTKYSGKRQLYFETSKDGTKWTQDRKLAAISEEGDQYSGHYQVSNTYQGEIIGTFFNRHPNGNVDKRTDLYYIQTADFGKNWTTVDGEEVSIPLKDVTNSCRAVDYASQGKNVYMKDMAYDDEGKPICLYIRSNGHEPGPKSAPYEWCISKWNGNRWQTHVVTNSDHNYDTGSLFVSENSWKIVGPTISGPQKWGVGGELAIWESTDKGENWNRALVITDKSKLSHSYVRRPSAFQAPFCFFWSNGHSHDFSRSDLYFGNFNGEIWKLPYYMKSDFEKPIRVR